MKMTYKVLILLLINASCNNSQKNDQKVQQKVNNESSITAKQNQRYDIGDIATDFKLKNVDGKMVSLSNYKNAKGFIIIFTANHCPVSKAYEDRIIALDKKYDPKNFPVIAINPTDPDKIEADSYKNMQKYANEKGFIFPYLFDPGQKISQQFGATNTPHVFVLKRTNAGNKVAYIGAIDDNAKNPSAVQKRYVENAVDALLAVKEPKITKTKAIGCGISY